MRPNFTAFTLKFKGTAARITTPVSVYRAFDPDKPPKPAFPQHKTTALWDTGATNSSITTKTIEALGLKPVGRTVVNHAGGRDEANTYLGEYNSTKSCWYGGGVGMRMSEHCW